MRRISDIAIESEDDAYMEGAEDGFWRGYMEGANATRLYIMGESDINPSAPEEFWPLGPRYFNKNFAQNK